MTYTLCDIARRLRAPHTLISTLCPHLSSGTPHASNMTFLNESRFGPLSAVAHRTRRSPAFSVLGIGLGQTCVSTYETLVFELERFKVGST